MKSTRGDFMAKRPDPRLSHQTLRVTKVFLDGPPEGLAGSDIWKELGLLSGTVYPILLRLEAAGWLKGSWEKESPEVLGRPRKRIYRLTPLGYNKAREALAALDVQVGSPAWKF
jgi:DNA-binding MarR family transcriptional regulator